MARTQKFPEDLLLEAVIKFSEIEKGKIKATELASWARSNVTGLEEVHDYHFMRPVREKDARTGEISVTKKPCTARMEEINRARSLTETVNRNVLLRAASIDTFMDQPDYIQRRQITETRETVDRILSKNAGISRENEALQAENNRLKAVLSSLADKVDALEKEQDLLNRKVHFLMKTSDEAACREMLGKMGITDGEVDLNVYAKSLTLGIKEVVDITRLVTRHMASCENISEEGLTGQNTGSLADDVMAGLHFGENSDEQPAE
ncbi:MAG: hypothetical protein IJV14_00010 [Lachnospiraceae bacterium]|nr:hypothetical protein [Lachnospiraceae bacterium]